MQVVVQNSRRAPDLDKQTTVGQQMCDKITALVETFTCKNIHLQYHLVLLMHYGQQATKTFVNSRNPPVE